MPSGEVGNDVWAFLGFITTAAVAGAVQGFRGWKSAKPDDEPRKGGQAGAQAVEERFRKVYIESAELADLNVLRALPTRLDALAEKLQDNHAIMRSVERTVDGNHRIMVTVEDVVKQNNQILIAVHDVRDMIVAAKEREEQRRLDRIEDRLRDREEREDERRSR